MTLYRLTITKRISDGNDAGKEWNNVYHLNEASLAAAVLAAPPVVDLEKTIYPGNVSIVRWAVHNPALRSDGQSTSVAVPGTRGAGTAASQLPLFNVVMFRFITTGGRPSLHYLRLPLDESEVTNGQVAQTVLDAISSGWAVPLIALGTIVSVKGNAYTGYGFDHNVRDRQLGWHRRKRPGFKRGWVPSP